MPIPYTIMLEQNFENKFHLVGSRRLIICRVYFNEPQDCITVWHNRHLSTYTTTYPKYANICLKIIVILVKVKLLCNINKNILKHIQKHNKSDMLSYKNIMPPAVKISYIALVYLQHGSMP